MILSRRETFNKTKNILYKKNLIMNNNCENTIYLNDSSIPTVNEGISLWLLSRGWELVASYRKGDIWRNEELNQEYVILNNLDTIPYGVEMFALQMEQFYPDVRMGDLIKFFQFFCKPST